MRHVTGYFVNQFAAESVMDKLLDRGVPRDRLRIVAAQAPTAVDPPDDPRALGHTSLVVVVGGEWNETVVRDFLEDEGADEIAIGSSPLPEDEGNGAPVTGEAISSDVKRAIEAAKRGARGDG